MTRIATTIDEASELLHGRRSVCCIGVFDGVHLGHQKLVRSAIEEARREHTSSVVFTFRNHPLSVLAPAYAPALLTDADEKLRRLKELHPSDIILVTFDPKFARTEPEDFVLEVLAKRLGVISIWCGRDFRFGRGGRGNLALLEQLRPRSGIEAQTIEPVLLGPHAISSSWIRSLIEEGEVERAAQALGRRHLVRGRVVHGFGRGRELTFPTANLELPGDLALPPDGIYAVQVEVGRERFGGMLNLGPAPTFDIAERRFEVHLLDYKGDLFGKMLTIHLVSRLREIRKFDSAARLIAQIRADERRTRRILESFSDEQ